MEEKPSWTDQPNEMLQNQMEFMTPDGLLAMRTTQTVMRDNVDAVVTRLIASGDLIDGFGQPPPPGTDPATVLRDWRDGRYSRPSLQVSLSPAEALATYDPIFQLDNPGWQDRSERIKQPVRADYIGQLADSYSLALSAEALTEQADLQTYISALLNAGRLVDNSGNRLPPNTSVDVAIARWRNGDLNWLPPQ